MLDAIPPHFTTELFASHALKLAALALMKIPALFVTILTV